MHDNEQRGPEKEKRTDEFLFDKNVAKFMNIHSHIVCSKRKSCLLNDCETKCRDVTTIGSGKVFCMSPFSC